MKTGLNIVSGLLILIGSVFALQGAGILPGSMMSGDSFWLYVGIIMVIVGIALLVYKNRQKPDAGGN
jgi:hypothetical protein